MFSHLSEFSAKCADAARPALRLDRSKGRRLLLTAAVLSTVLLAACSESRPAEQESAIDAVLVTVETSTISDLHSVAGTVRAETTSTLASNVVGSVVRVRVAEGDRVRAGDILVEIDAREPRAMADRARAGRAEVEHAIESATANARLAEATFRRYAALRERGSASAQELDEALARHTSAQAELQRLVARRAEAGAAQAQADAVLAYSTVRSPIDGVVTERLVDPGAQAAPGVPLLTVQNEQGVRIDASVPEGIPVQAGARAIVTAGAQKLRARVTRVQPSLDNVSRSALVQLSLDQPLRPGTYVQVSFPTGEHSAVTVPVATIVRRGQLTSVLVAGPDDVVRMRLVTLGTTLDASVGASGGSGVGRIHEPRVEILSGLTAGERILAAPAGVSEGVTVRSAS